MRKNWAIQDKSFQKLTTWHSNVSQKLGCFLDFHVFFEPHMKSSYLKKQHVHYLWPTLVLIFAIAAVYSSKLPQRLFEVFLIFLFMIWFESHSCHTPKKSSVRMQEHSVLSSFFVVFDPANRSMWYISLHHCRNGGSYWTNTHTRSQTYWRSSTMTSTQYTYTCGLIILLLLHTRWF